MPSSKTDSQQDTSDSFKQFYQLIEKKKRNLEKKKNKLEDYQKKARHGEQLNDDQQLAVSKYDGVLQSLDFIKEVMEQGVQLNADNERLLKKAFKRDKLERDRQSAESVMHFVRIQSVLNDLGQDECRGWFQEGLHGCFKLSEEQLGYMDSLYTLLNPTREVFPVLADFDEAVRTVGEVVSSLFDGKERSALNGVTTYKELRKIFDSILECDFYKNSARPEKSPLVTSNGVEAGHYDDAEEQMNVEEATGEVAEEVEVAECWQEEPLVCPEPEPTAVPLETGRLRNDVGISGNISTCTSPPSMGAPVKETIQDVIEPLRSSFNFLQASEVLVPSPDPVVLKSAERSRNNSYNFAHPVFHKEEHPVSNFPKSVSPPSAMIEQSAPPPSSQNWSNNKPAATSWSDRVKPAGPQRDQTSKEDFRNHGGQIQQQGDGGAGDVFSMASHSEFLHPETNTWVSIGGNGGSGGNRGDRKGGAGGRGGGGGRGSRGGVWNARGESKGGRGGSSRSARGGGRQDMQGDSDQPRDREGRGGFRRNNSRGEQQSGGYRGGRGGGERGGGRAFYNNRENQSQQYNV